METLSVATIRARFPAPRIPQLGGAYPGNYDCYCVGGAVRLGSVTNYCADTYPSHQ
jgi:hypothetical protein